jgi:spore maturation protein CgeB
MSAERPLRILYASGLSPNDSSLYRLWALERQGHHVIPLNAYGYEPSSALIRKIVHRAQVGPSVTRLNRDILAIAERERPDIFWADKLLSLQPQTLERLRRMGIGSVSYMIDNVFGVRGDPGWRLYKKDLTHFDLHAVQRDKNVIEYRDHGARDVIKIQTAYEPTIHFPPPPGLTDKDRDHGVSFIGTPYDDRANFLTSLWKNFNLPVAVSGSSVWRERLSAEAQQALYSGRELYGKDYRESIWRAKINLSFLTHSNHDEFAHKSFEIAACEGFLLVERSPGHLARFVEDEEAVMFEGLDECVQKIRRYLPDEESRCRIAAAGRLRAERSGYHNDAQVAKIVECMRHILSKTRQST